MFKYEYYIVYQTASKKGELIVTTTHKLNSANVLNDTREDIEHLVNSGETVIILNFKLLKRHINLRGIFNRKIKEVYNMAMPLKATKQELRDKISELGGVIDRQNEEWNDLVKTCDELKESVSQPITEGENDTINKQRDEINQLIQDKEKLQAQLEEMSKRFDADVEHVECGGDDKLSELMKENETLRRIYYS